MVYFIIEGGREGDGKEDFKILAMQYLQADLYILK